jgi:hypothetical protein
MKAEHSNSNTAVQNIAQRSATIFVQVADIFEDEQLQHFNKRT